MCYPSTDTYDAYKSGDYTAWQSAYDSYNTLNSQISSGTLPDGMTSEQANAKLTDLKSQVDSLSSKIKSDSAANLEMRDYENQHDVKSAQGKIDSAFSQFDDAYYDKYKQTYIDYYTPDLDKQYSDARGTLLAALAGRGMTNSTMGTSKVADLYGDYTDATTDVANKAVDAANTLKGNVENTKTNLYTLAESASDPASVSARAVGEATALTAQPTYSALGDVFASALAPYLYYTTAKQSSGSGVKYVSPSYATGSGSGKVIG